MNRNHYVVRIETPHLTIEGKSRAGNETWFRVRELGVALDIGRCPDELIGIAHVFVTHAHLDHASGIPFYAAQRKLQRLPTGTIYLPAESVDDMRLLMEVHHRLENASYPLELVGMFPGDVVSLRRDLEVRAHRSPHRVAAVGYEFSERRTKIDPSLVGLPDQEIARRRRESPELFRVETKPLLYYTGDTDAGVFDGNEVIFQAEVLMIECSFTGENDHQRATQYQHIHLDDLFERSDLFACEVLLLTHFSLRDDPAEIHGLISRRAPERLRQRIRLALPEPFSRLAPS